MSRLQWVYPEVDRVTRVYKCHISDIDWTTRQVWAPGDVCKLWRNNSHDDVEGLVVAVFDGGHELLVLWSKAPVEKQVTNPCNEVLLSDHTLLAFNQIDLEAEIAKMRQEKSIAT